MKTNLLQLLCAGLLAAGTAVHAADLDLSQIEQIIGTKGVFNTNEGVFKITVPRNDRKISVDGRVLPPFMGLASWAAFKPGMNGNVMVMGDTALFQDEVNPAMSAALDHGLAVTALHNHFFYDEPKVYFMHISGEGSAAKLATSVRAVWDEIKKVRAASPHLSGTFGGLPVPDVNAITGKTIEDILA